MSEVERGTSKDKYLTGNGKRTVVDQKSGLPLKKFFNTSGLLYKEKHLRAAHCTISHS